MPRVAARELHPTPKSSPRSSTALWVALAVLSATLGPIVIVLFVVEALSR